MRTTAYFATNRVVKGPAVASYTAAIVPPFDPTVMSQGGFSVAANDDVAHADRDLLVFVHGFDNDFSDALTRAARR
jgi:hypothetical protein